MRTSTIGWLLVCIGAAPCLAGAVNTEIVLCIDVSPSISVAELELEKAGLRDNVNNPMIVPQNGTVAVGIVTYADVAANVLTLTPVTPQSLTNTINPAINAITRSLNASTNISAGLQFARNLLEGPASQTENDFILLSGDGAHNTGNPEPEVTCPQVRNAGITICAIAVDASLSGEADLENCANPPQGQFGVADTFDDFEPVCTECLVFFLGVQCEGPTVCNDPGTCQAAVACDEVALCESSEDMVESDCSPDGPYPVGANSVEVTCTANGNIVEQMTCSVTVNDCDDPDITCPDNTTIACEASTSPTQTGLPTAEDNCTASPMISITDEQTTPGACGGFILRRTWTATDPSGNSASCMQTISAADAANPNLTCPAFLDLICSTPDGVPSAGFNLGVHASDDCDPNVMLTDDRPKGYFPPTCGSSPEPTVVTVVAEDACGNSTTCTVPVFVTGQACCPIFVEADTDLTLLPADQDFRQDHLGPVTTKANFDIWNSNEVRFSGTERCITCWDQTLLSAYDVPNHFFIDALQTDHGKARIDGIPSVVCNGDGRTSVSTPLLGMALRDLDFVGDDRSMRTGTTLVGIGGQFAQIVYDADIPPDDSAPFPVEGKNAQESLIRGGRRDAATDPTDGDSPPEELGILEDNLGGVSKKGSLLYWTKAEIKWNAQGELIEDTIISLVNDNAADVRIQFYQVNGDEPLDAVIFNGQVVERAHPGWNKSDFEIVLTADESTYWSAATGEPKGVSPFWLLDNGNPRGRPDLDPGNPGGRVVRGFLVGWAVNDDGNEVRWNHLEGKAVILHYAKGNAAEYDAWSFQCITDALTGQECDGIPRRLNMDAEEYEAAPERLLFDFFATGSRAFSPPGPTP